jgi:hypothetical protein
MRFQANPDGTILAQNVLSWILSGKASKNGSGKTHELSSWQTTKSI